MSGTTLLTLVYCIVLKIWKTSHWKSIIRLPDRFPTRRSHNSTRAAIGEATLKKSEVKLRWFHPRSISISIHRRINVFCDFAFDFFRDIRFGSHPDFDFKDVKSNCKVLNTKTEVQTFTEKSIEFRTRSTLEKSPDVIRIEYHEKSHRRRLSVDVWISSAGGITLTER